MNKTFNIILIVFLSVLLVGISGLFIYLLKEKPKLFSDEKYDLVIDKTFEKEYDEINIKSKAGNIIVKETDDKVIRVLINGNEETSSAKENGNTLEISELGNKCKYLCFYNKLSEIEVSIPKDYNKIINIKNNYGDIEVGEFLNTTLNISENAGDIVVKAGLNIDAENNLGEIKIGNVLNFIKAKENAGNIKIDKLNIKENSSLINDLGNIQINSIDEIHVDAKTNLGKVFIAKNYESDIILKIENRLGDIKVR